MEFGMSRGFNRRNFVRGIVASSAVPIFGQTQLSVPRQPAAPSIAKNTLAPHFTKSLDAEMLRYMTAMNAPGMQLTLTDLHGAEYIASYGYENLQTAKPLTPQRLMQVGSISKSMGAVCILQLVDEGKLDLHKPVMEYLPWLPWNTPFGAVTLHHVLTHTSGLPDGGALFFPNNRWQHRQRYAPGTRYYYSNMAYNTVGHIVAQCDGRCYQESLVKRVFEPAGMATARPQIGGANWLAQAVSYIPAIPDKPYERFGPLCEAPQFHEETSAGCVLASPADMACYLRSLLRGGVTDNGKRILSEAGFAAMTRHWTGAEEWGKGAGYGYGVGVKTVDGDRVLVHTGGMVSFMSSMYLNLSRGVAAFASINAQQGYRPTPAVTYATQAFTANQTKAAMPSPIEIPKTESAKPPAPATKDEEKKYAELTGHYVNDDPWEGSVEVVERDGNLYVQSNALVPVGDGSFYAEFEPEAPDRCAFACVVDGKAKIFLMNGTEYHRFHPPA